MVSDVVAVIPLAVVLTIAGLLPVIVLIVQHIRETPSKRCKDGGEHDWKRDHWERFYFPPGGISAFWIIRSTHEDETWVDYHYKCVKCGQSRVERTAYDGNYRPRGW